MDEIVNLFSCCGLVVIETIHSHIIMFTGKCLGCVNLGTPLGVSDIITLFKVKPSRSSDNKGHNLDAPCGTPRMRGVW